MIELQICSDELRNASGKIIEWFKAEKDFVVKDEPLLLVETNKVSLEVVSPASGYLQKIKKSVGDDITVEDILALINPQSDDSTQEQNSEPPLLSTPLTASLDGKRQSPVVRRLLYEFSLDIADISASGHDGRITKADVENYLQKNQLTRICNADSKLYPFTDRQRFAATAIMQSVSEIPHVTAVFEADLGAVVKDREENYSANHRPSITAYLIECLRDNLLIYPQLNGHYTDEGVRNFTAINVGIITSLPNHDIVIPTLKQTNQKTLLDIARGIETLKLAATDGRLRLSDIDEATFSISNYGVSGAIFATPIIIPSPQIAVLGVGKMEWRQRIIKTEQGFSNRIYPAVYLTLTIDHRAINGSLANLFMSHLVKSIEQYGSAVLKKEAS